MDPRTDELVAELRRAGCVFAEDEAAVLRAAADGDRLAALVARRVAGEPLEHVVGRVELGGVEFAVGPGVFVPRQRSLLLVDLAVGMVPPGGVLVDACCGCGAIGALVAHRVEQAQGATAELHACDVDPVALGFARQNVAPFAGEVHEGDLLAALPARLRGRVDVVVANAPYVPSEQVDLMPREARDHEPRHALDGGRDGLDLHRRLADQVGGWLAPGGHVLVETSERQAAESAEVFAARGLEVRVERSDELDATVVVGIRATARAGQSGNTPVDR